MIIDTFYLHTHTHTLHIHFPLTTLSTNITVGLTAREVAIKRDIKHLSKHETDKGRKYPVSSKLIFLNYEESFFK